MPPTAKDEHENKFLDVIESHGWHVTLVLGDDEGPCFAYSTGIFQRCGHPEVIVFGLETKVGHFVVNEYARRVIADGAVEIGRCYDGFLEAFDVVFLEATDVALKDKHTTWTSWYYDRRPFPLVQGVWPEKQTGLFPWEPGFPDEYRALQPLLGPVPGLIQ